MVNKILVVDDSKSDLENLTSIVVKEGYQVVTATNGEEAVIKAKKILPDLILMDIIMDDKDGFEACREIVANKLTKNIPIIFVTGKCEKVDRVWAELQGGKGLVGKPYTPEQIVSQINRYAWVI